MSFLIVGGTYLYKRKSPRYLSRKRTTLGIRGGGPVSFRDFSCNQSVSSAVFLHLQIFLIVTAGRAGHVGDFVGSNRGPPGVNQAPRAFE